MTQYMPFPEYNPMPTPEVSQPPCSGYIGRIEHAVIELDQHGRKRLCLTLEISEGSYAGWFAADLRRRQGGQYAANHRGRYLLYFPRGDGSQQDGWTIDKFNRAFQVITKSNPGFVWDGTDRQLIGKAVGFVIREVEWNGHVFLEIGKLVSVGAIQTKNYRLMPRRINKPAHAQQAPAFPPNTIPSGFTPIEPDDTFPF